MSAATVLYTETATVYVRLLNEGVDVWRPVVAERLGASTYRLQGGSPPEDEAWAFRSGEVVVAEPGRFADGKEGLVAVARVSDFDRTSQALAG